MTSDALLGSVLPAPSACARNFCPFGEPCREAAMERVLRTSPAPAAVVCLVDHSIVWENAAAQRHGVQRERHVLDIVAPERHDEMTDALVRVASGTPDTHPVKVQLEGADVDATIVGLGRASNARQAVMYLPHRDDRAARLERTLEAIARELSRAGVTAPAAVMRIGGVPGIEMLSERELRVLELVADGRRIASIANDLYVSQSTVRNYLSAIYRKLGVGNLSDLLELLLARGSRIELTLR
jgi:DNA-binding NarL/FixJ family response regulator